MPSVLPRTLATLVFLHVAQVAFVAIYLASERNFYFWDHAMYLGMAQSLFEAGLGPAVQMFKQSFGGDYNLLYALPSQPVFALFGATRESFILGHFFFFFLTFQAAMGLVLRQVFGLTWKTALLAAMMTTCAQPALWRPLLEGFPDHGASAALTLALGLFLSPNRRWGRAILIGLALGLCIVLRRHFVYAAFALMTIETIFLAVKGRGALRNGIAFLALCGLITTAVVGIFEFDYAVKAFTTDFRALYKSYESSAWDFFLFAASYVGLAAMVLTGMGWVASLRLFPAQRAKLLYVAAFGVLSLVLWMAGPSQASGHYLLHEVFILGGVGLTGLGLALSRIPSSRQQKTFTAVAFSVLLTNSFVALWGGHRPEATAPTRLGLWASPRPPMVRMDYDQLLALGRHLIETTKPTDHIVVVGSSFTLNLDLLRVVIVDALKRPDIARRLVLAPEIDSRGQLPFDALAGGTVFIVPDAPQYHLAPEGQKVVTALSRFFPVAPIFETLFRQDDTVFNLENNLGVSIWRRTAPWSPEILQAALSVLRGIVDGPQSWIVLEPALGSRVQTAPIGLSELATGLGFEQPQFKAVFLHNLQPDVYRLHGYIERGPGCENARLILRTITPAGREILAHPVVANGRFVEIQKTFKLETSNENSGFIELDIEANPPFPCAVFLHELAVERP